MDPLERTRDALVDRTVEQALVAVEEGTAPGAGRLLEPQRVDREPRRVSRKAMLLGTVGSFETGGTVALDRSWRELLGESDSFEIDARRRELVESLTEADVAQLVAICQEGTEAERYAAIGILMGLRDSSDARLPPAQVEKWERLVERLARSEFPNTDVGVRSFQAWIDGNRSAAARYVTDELSLSHIRSEAGQRALIVQLRALGSRDALEKLEEMMGLEVSASLSEALERAIEALRPVTGRRLKALGRAWRATKSSEALERAASALIAGRAPGTVSIDEVRNLLGPPTSQSPGSLYYAPGLVIDLDEDERVVAFHLA